MSDGITHPSTLDGIKRLAKSIKRGRGIQHARALDAAALTAGYQNFRHAKNALRDGVKLAVPSAGHCVYLTVPWKDRSTGADGEERLTILLSEPWGNLATVPQLRMNRALDSFWPDAPDHLGVHNYTDSRSQARRIACAAARTLQFMDSTKLRPSSANLDRVLGVPLGKHMPGCDHPSVWYDKESKRHLVADEPYELAIRDRGAEREAWAKKYGAAMATSSWPGMYNPDGGTCLILVSNVERGAALGPVVGAVGQMPAPIVEQTWNGVSASVLPIFLSPGRRAAANVAKT
jgi:hypothetical protein